MFFQFYETDQTLNLKSVKLVAFALFAHNNKWLNQSYPMFALNLFLTWITNHLHTDIDFFFSIKRTSMMKSFNISVTIIPIDLKRKMKNLTV